MAEIFVESASIENISDLAMYARIERGGRVCYRSEGKITNDSALGFVNRIKNRKHYSVLGHSQLLIETNALGAYKMWNACPQQLKGQITTHLADDSDQVIIGTGVDVWLQLFIEAPMLAAIGLSNIFVEKFPEIFGDLGITENILEIPISFAPSKKVNMNILTAAHMFKETFILDIDRATAMQLRTYRNATHSVESQRYNNYTKKGFHFIRPSEVTDEFFPVWKSHKRLEALRYEDYISAGFKPEFARCNLGSDICTQMVITASLWEWKHIFEARLNTATQSSAREVVQMIKDNLLEKYKGNEFAEYLGDTHVV